MLHAIAELFGRIVLDLVIYLLLLPINALLATPFILIGAPFTGRGYLEAVKDGYYNVYDFWSRVLIWL